MSRAGVSVFRGRILRPFFLRERRLQRQADGTGPAVTVADGADRCYTGAVKAEPMGANHER